MNRKYNYFLLIFIIMCFFPLNIIPVYFLPQSFFGLIWSLLIVIIYLTLLIVIFKDNILLKYKYILIIFLIVCFYIVSPIIISIAISNFSDILSPDCHWNEGSGSWGDCTNLSIKLNNYSQIMWGIMITIPTGLIGIVLVILTGLSMKIGDIRNKNNIK